MQGKASVPVNFQHQQADRRFNPYQLPAQHVRQMQPTQGVSNMRPTAQNGQINGNTHMNAPAVHSNQAMLQNKIQSCQMNGTNIAVNSFPSSVVRQNRMPPEQMLNPSHHLQRYTASVPTGQCGNYRMALPQQCYASNTGAPINRANVPRRLAVNSSQAMQHAVMHRSGQAQPLQANRMQPVRLQAPSYNTNGAHGMEISSQQLTQQMLQIPQQMAHIPNPRVQFEHSRQMHLNGPSNPRIASMVNQAGVAGRSQSVPLSHMNISTNYNAPPTTANIQRLPAGDSKQRSDLPNRPASQRFYAPNELNTLLQTSEPPRNQLPYFATRSSATHETQMHVQNIDPGEPCYSSQSQVQRKAPANSTRRSHPLMTYPMSVAAPVYRGQISQQQQVRPLNNMVYQQRNEQTQHTQERIKQGSPMHTAVNPRRILQRRWSLPQEQMLGKTASRYLATSPLTQAVNQDQQYLANPATVYRTPLVGMRSFSAPSPNYNRDITNGGDVQILDNQLDSFMQNNGQATPKPQYQHRRPTHANAPPVAYAGNQVVASENAYIQSHSSVMPHPRQQHRRHEISESMLNQVGIFGIV